MWKFGVIFIFTGLLVIVMAERKMVGGLSGPKEATKEVQDLIDQVKGQVEQENNGGTAYSTFQAIEYKTQVVAGTNYFVKVKVGDGQYIILRIWKKLDQTVSLTSVQTDKTKEDPIEYF